MTQPVDFEGSTHHFGPPPGVPESECGWMHVYSDGSHTVSAWKPSPEALAALNAGEPIFVTHQCGMNPHAPGHPLVFPTFCGSEAEALAVVGRNGVVWK